MTSVQAGTGSKRTPDWIAAIIDWPLFSLAARVALTSAYWTGGLNKLLDFPRAVAEQHHFGLEPAALLAAITIFIELAGSACVISGRYVWLGAGALGIFTLMANFIANAFWNLSGEARFMAMNGFFEHIGLVGGFMIATIALRRQERSLAP